MMERWEKICKTCRLSHYEELVDGEELWCDELKEMCSAKTVRACGGIPLHYLNQIIEDE